MKTILYALSFMFLLASCASVDKLVRKGNYEEAFSKGISYFSGSKKRKTADVKAFEKAYQLLTERDLAEIERLKWSSGSASWSHIVRMYENLERRQFTLNRILPLVSEDGYTAVFEFKDYASLVRNAKEQAALVIYQSASDMLAKAEIKKDKNMAKRAYVEFEKVESYLFNFRDVRTLKEKALTLGHKIIYVDIRNDISGRAGKDIDKTIWNYALGRHDDLWHSFRFREDDDMEDGDMLVLLDIHHLDISPEKENNIHFTEQKDILVRTDKWIEKKDSVEVEKIKEYYQTVSANLIETFREKNAILEGGVRWLDLQKNSIISEKPVNVHFSFADRGMKFVGDERALNDETKKRLDFHLDNFPVDEEIVYYLVGEYKKVMGSELNRTKS
jgi:hypothetical protein